MSLIVKGFGLFNDAYQLFVMNIVNVILEEEFSQYKTGQETVVSTAVFVGAVIGQIVLGALADQLGRKWLMVISCSLLIIGGIFCTVAYAPDTTTFIYVLAFARFILGIGIGAEYPLAAASSSEISDPAERGPAVALVFSLQGAGQLFAAFCGNILCQLYARREPYSNQNLDIIWRVLFAIGTLPAIGIFYFRWTAQESSHFEETQRMAKQTGFYETLTYFNKMKIAFKYYYKELIGTAGSWFIFDVVFYAQGIFSDSVISAINKKQGTNLRIMDTSLKNVFLALGALPGYYVAVATINKLGRRNMQLQGFIIMGVIFFIMGFFWHTIAQNGAVFVSLYALTFFFSNFGPNTSTFVLPVEVFPTAIRATCHGLAAAAGKIGATVGTSTFGVAQDAYGKPATFIFCAIIAWAGAVLTIFFTWDGPTHHNELNSAFFKNVSVAETSGYIQTPVSARRSSRSQLGIPAHNDGQSLHNNIDEQQQRLSTQSNMNTNTNTNSMLGSENNFIFNSLPITEENE